MSPLRSLAFAMLCCACHAGGAKPGNELEQRQHLPSEATPAAIDSTLSAARDSADLLGPIYRVLRAIGQDRPTVESRLGKPSLATRETKPDPDDSITTDTLVRWSYDQLAFTFLLVGHDVLVETRAAVDYAPIIAFGTQVATPDQAEARLGVPGATQTRGDTTVLVYTVGSLEMGWENSITLYFVRGRLVQIGALPVLG